LKFLNVKPLYHKIINNPLNGRLTIGYEIAVYDYGKFACIHGRR